MDLRTYLFDLDVEGRTQFAKRCGTTRGHLQNIAYGFRKPSTLLAVAIDRESDGQVTRRDLFPETYAEMWPEMA